MFMTQQNTRLLIINGCLKFADNTPSPKNFVFYDETGPSPEVAKIGFIVADGRETMGLGVIIPLSNELS